MFPAIYKLLEDPLARLNLYLREKLVIQLRYGLTDDHEYTLAEIGSILELSRERVRQIQEEALGKLRRPTSLKYFEEISGGKVLE